MSEENENKSIQMAFHFCLNEFLPFAMLFSKLLRYISLVLETMANTIILKIWKWLHKSTKLEFKMQMYILHLGVIFHFIVLNVSYHALMSVLEYALKYGKAIFVFELKSR